MSKPVGQPTQRSSKKTNPVNRGDELIADLILKRKLQQEALLKIMTSIEETVDEKKEARVFKLKKKTSPAKIKTSKNTTK